MLTFEIIFKSVLYCVPDILGESGGAQPGLIYDLGLYLIATWVNNRMF